MADLGLNDVIDTVVETTITKFEDAIKSMDIESEKSFKNDIEQLIQLFGPFES